MDKPKIRPLGRCAQCGGLFALKTNGQPYAHKSGNPDDWYANIGRVPKITNSPPQPCRGENMPARPREE